MTIEQPTDVFDINYSAWNDPDLKARATNREGQVDVPYHKSLVGRQVAYLSLQYQLDAPYSEPHDDHYAQVAKCDAAVQVIEDLRSKE